MCLGKRNLLNSTVLEERMLALLSPAASFAERESSASKAAAEGALCETCHKDEY